MKRAEWTLAEQGIMPKEADLADGSAKRKREHRLIRRSIVAFCLVGLFLFVIAKMIVIKKRQKAMLERADKRELTTF
jgi:hypothetical protein